MNEKTILKLNTVEDWLQKINKSMDYMKAEILSNVSLTDKLNTVSIINPIKWCIAQDSIEIIYIIISMLKIIDKERLNAKEISNYVGKNIKTVKDGLQVINESLDELKKVIFDAYFGLVDELDKPLLPIYPDEINAIREKAINLIIVIISILEIMDIDINKRIPVNVKDCTTSSQKKTAEETTDIIIAITSATRSTAMNERKNKERGRF